MKRRAFLAALWIVLLSGLGAQAQGIRRQELLGLHIGAVKGSSTLDRAFGAGSELELYFIEGLRERFGVVVSASSHNFGSSRDTLLNIEYSGINRDVEMSIFSLTAGAYYLQEISQRYKMAGEIGCGLYAVTANVSSGIISGYRTENRFGIYSGTGFLMRLSRGVSMDLNVKVHYIFIGSDELEPIHFYTGSTSTYFLQVSLGLLLFGS